MKVSLLNRDLLFGQNSSDVIKIFGRKMGASDLAILQGVKSTRTKDVIGHYTANSWTTSKNDTLSVVCVDRYGNEIIQNPTSTCGLIRPILKIENEDSIDLQNTKEERFYNGNSVEKIMIYEFGRYPQTIVDKDLSSKLETLLCKNIRTSGRQYTFNKHKIYKEEIPEFRAYKCPEYEYNGENYIRIFGQPTKECLLSNNEQVEYGKIYWVKVEPIRWLVDKKNKILISETGLLSGIPFSTSKNYDGNFENTLTYKYLNIYFINEIIDTKKLCRSKTIVLPKMKEYNR